MEEYLLLIVGKLTNSTDDENLRNITPSTLKKLFIFQSFKANTQGSISSQLYTYKEYSKEYSLIPHPKHTIISSHTCHIPEDQCTHSVIRFTPQLIITGKGAYTLPDRFQAALKKAAS